MESETYHSKFGGRQNKLKRFLEESECHVAISMHDPIPSERAELMPAEKGMGIEQVVELLRNYDFSHQRRLSFEYIVFKGVNDSMQHAKAIIKLVKGLDCRFNLIRFHQIPDIPLQGVNDEKWNSSVIISLLMESLRPSVPVADRISMQLVACSVHPRNRRNQRARGRRTLFAIIPFLLR